MEEIRLPSGTRIYRGDTGFYLGESRGTRKVVFFGLRPEEVEEYGIVAIYETREDLHLLDLGQVDTLSYLLELAPPEVEEDIRLSFSRHRDSEPHRDRRVAEWICTLGYHGYFAPFLETEMGGSFHPEIAICDPSVKVSFIEFDTRGNVESYIHKHRMLERERERKERYKRKKRGRRLEPLPSSVRKSLF